jgi:sterol 14-demethylase
MTVEQARREPPRVSGGDGENDHLEEYRRDPIALMTRVRAECGDVGQFTFGTRDVVLLTGADANEFYFRAPEEHPDLRPGCHLRRAP